jgi:small subunit ribosomal protein S17
MAEKKVKKTEETPEVAEDSGTESAGAAVAGEETVEETKAEAPSEDAAVAEQPEAPVAEEAAAAEPEPAAEEAPAEEAPAAEEPAAEPEPPAVSQPKKKFKRLPRALRHKHSKPARERPATRKPITRIPKPDGELGRRQERRGVVVSDKGDKTIVVKVEMIKAHPKYKKVVRSSNKLHAHDEQNSAGIGDVVRIVETRPLSKTKHWRLAEIVEKAK